MQKVKKTTAAVSSKIVEQFCKRHNITVDQFLGKSKIDGDLDLRSLTSIPEGFNPTVGGYLYLRSLTSIPEGFNPTVGGDLYLGSLTSIPEGFNPTVGGYLDLPYKFRGTVQVNKPEPGFRENLRRNKLLFWKDGQFVKADGIFTEVISKKGNLYKVKKVHSTKEFYLITDGKLHAHGDTAAKAKEDFRFKVMAEKLKKEPITADTIITMQHYRVITGACELGVKSWMEQNNIKENSMVASELLPLLKKTNAYGLDRFLSLVSF